MPGGISWEQTAKRDRFIEKAIIALQTTAESMGYKKISKETLSLLMQRYKQKHNPPALPGKVKRSKLTLIEVKDE